MLCQWCHSGVFIISLTCVTPVSSISIIDFEPVIVFWVAWDPITALKITAGQRSLTLATVFVIAKKLHRTVIMTDNAKMRQQLLTTKTTFATSFKIIFAILCHMYVKQTKPMTGTLYRQLGIPRWSVTI